MQVDQPQEHVAIDATTDQPRRITVEPDRHGMTIRFDGSDAVLVIDLSKGYFNVHYFLDNYQEWLCRI